MSYFKVLGLEEEPFSTSPDPAFFYESISHREALLRLEIGIKLKRGLSVILGDVGYGKTTLARKLFSVFSDKSKYDFNMILDPTADSESEFLAILQDLLEIKSESPSVFSCKRALERYLFQKGVEENKTTILLIDEAQKLAEPALEVLRMLLNYETNKFKILQLVLFGQIELLPLIRAKKNFWDRISLKYRIEPLTRQETKEMIHFRLTQVRYPNGYPLFNEDAIDAIYEYTQGCPRRINMICHDALEILVMKNLSRVNREVIQGLVAEELQVRDGQYSAFR